MNIRKYAITSLILSLLVCLVSYGKPIDNQTAASVARSWLAEIDSSSMNIPADKLISDTQTVTDSNGIAIFYVISFSTDGFIIISADDNVEPIIAFSGSGHFSPPAATGSNSNSLAASNTLFDLATNDLQNRIGATKIFQAQQSTMSAKTNSVSSSINLGLSTLEENKLRIQIAEAAKKWSDLISLASESRSSRSSNGLGSISDVWISPLLQTKWGQTKDKYGCDYCYNYYTPTSTGHYPCGCVATAGAQVLKYFEHPQAGIGIQYFDITVDGNPWDDQPTRGGNGSGGPYDWASMINDPGCSATATQRQAIGALCYDVGLSVNMSYREAGSGADTLWLKNAFTNTFDYDNAIKGYNSGNNIGSGLTAMINPNLDASRPVILGITGDGGHAIVADGYGYNSSTLYHHLNLGWRGSDDLWYNLPNISTTYYNFNSVYKCVYNIFINGTGEIVSGRVTDSGGNPLSHATVTATRAGQSPITSITDNNGIYALEKLTSNRTYTISVAKNCYNFTNQSQPVTRSYFVAVYPYISYCGNVWGVNFTGTDDPTCADINQDTYVDFLDFALLAASWMTVNPTVDIDGMGSVDFDDLYRIADAWLLGH